MNGPENADAGFIAYLRAFFTDWLTGMCGPLSVPFAAAAVFRQQNTRKLFGAVLPWLRHCWGRIAFGKGSGLQSTHN
jgi:hypothetical protein